jgi:hypothetical protein
MTASQLVKCPNCGGGGKESRYLGDQFVCEHCGSSMSPKAVSCVKCGHPDGWWKRVSESTICSVCEGQGSVKSTVAESHHRSEAHEKRAKKAEDRLGSSILAGLIPCAMLGVVVGWYRSSGFFDTIGGMLLWLVALPLLYGLVLWLSSKVFSKSSEAAGTIQVVLAVGSWVVLCSLIITWCS